MNHVISTQCTVFLFSQLQFPCSLLFCTLNLVQLGFQHVNSFYIRKEQHWKPSFLSPALWVLGVSKSTVYMDLQGCNELQFSEA